MISHAFSRNRNLRNKVRRAGGKQQQQQQQQQYSSGCDPPSCRTESIDLLSSGCM